jgi:hypothetical protein
LEQLTSNPFFRVLHFSSEDLKPRIGNWRFAKVLHAAWGSIWIGGFILVLFGILPLSATRIIIPLAILFFIADLVYLMLYPLEE